jgi:uncharacterized protein (TIGR02145 family)
MTGTTIFKSSIKQQTNMKTKHFRLPLILAAVMTLTTFTLSAQVRIGGDEEPATGALLDLNSTVKGGLILSNVTITNVDSIPVGTNVFPGIIPATADVNLSLRGAMVYNTGEVVSVPSGIYVWNGYSWTTCGSSSNSAFLPAGNGTFTGKLVFDIAQGNNGTSDCGATGNESTRNDQKTTFSTRTEQDGAKKDYSGVQVYTFASTVGVSRVRFEYIDETGKAIDHIEPKSADYASGDNITEAKAVVHYKTSLDNDLKGLTRANALKVKLRVIYNSSPVYDINSPDQKIELDISLQDCGCCGAYTGANKTGWLNFMCHNLGADESALPFTPAAAIHGAKYQYGQKNAALSMADDQSNSGAVSGWSTSMNSETGNWPVANSPCPAGWRLPVHDEWTAVISASNNTRTFLGDSWSVSADNYATGLQLGDALFLPAVGFRDLNSGQLNNRGGYGYYWSSSADNDSHGYYMYFSHENVYSQTTSGYVNRSDGHNVRCVAE